MVNCLWQKSAKAETFDELRKPIYGDRHQNADANAFGSFRTSANIFFEVHHAPWRVSIKKNTVTLKAAE